MEPTGPSTEPFSILDVLADAWRSYSRTFTAHAGWNVAFFALAILVPCLTSCILVPVAAIGGIGAGEPSRIVPLVLVVLYGVLLLAFFVLFALHQGVTLAIARTEQRGETVVLGASVRDASGRLSTMSLVVLARFAADMSVNALVLGGVVAAVMAMQDARDPLALLGDPGVLWTALIGGYAVAFGWTLVVRAFLGLASPCAQYEEVGAFAALRRSVRLLEGRRLQLVGLRLVWALLGGAVYVLGYVPGFAVMLLAQQGPAWNLLALPLAFLTYFVALLLLSFDGTLEAALYARITRPRSVEDLAQVFR